MRFSLGAAEKRQPGSPSQLGFACSWPATRHPYISGSDSCSPNAALFLKSQLAESSRMKHFFCAALIGAAFFATGSLGRAEDDVKNSMADIERGPKLDPGNAEAKSRKARLEARPSPTFAITDVKATKTPDPDAETNLTLRIGIKKQPNATIDPSKVKIQVFLYDTVGDTDIRLTDASVNYEWLTPKHDWTDTNPEILSVNYLRRKRKTVPPRRVQGGERKYLGYRVLVYYDDKLQAIHAGPERLLQLFPPPENMLARSAAAPRNQPSRAAHLPFDSSDPRLLEPPLPEFDPEPTPIPGLSPPGN
jgi:hypothetical protein